jgi:phage tail-like protein
MTATRPFALIRTRDQWSRASHCQTAIDDATGGVQLSWTPPAATGGKMPTAGGMAFDGECRLYRSLPDLGRVERQLWKTSDPLGLGQNVASAVDLISGESPLDLGDFSLAPASGRGLSEPRGLAVDIDDRLFVAESGARRVLVYDLWSRRLLRRVLLADSANPSRHPMDIAGNGRQVWVLTADPPAVLRMQARSGPVPLTLDPPTGNAAGAIPIRVAVSPAGELFLLYQLPSGECWVIPVKQGAPPLAVGRAGDFEFDAKGYLVVAGAPGDPFRKFERVPEGWTEGRPLQGRGYDGMGLVRTPDGQIGFWTSLGLRTAHLARSQFSRIGWVTTYRLDSGEYQTRWGRMFLDACIPDGTQVRAHWATTDLTSDEPTIPRASPPNVDITLRRPDLSPPMPPLSLAPGLDDVRHPLHHRETGRELPWSRPPPDDPFETYEAPVQAEPGRYLWVTLELRGNTRSTPRVKCLRVEHPGHDLLRRLPRTYSRETTMATFINRYLGMFDGTITDLDGRAVERNILIEPCAAPEEVLPWLASFLGLVLDLRWPAAARRDLISQVNWLFRFRGTVPGLKKFLEIYLGFAVTIIERFRLIGLGGALLSNADAPATSRAIVGAGFRVGGAVGTMQEATLTGTLESAFQLEAHRFVVVIPAVLSDEQLAVVRHILDVHRPAHTAFDVCTVGAGMSVGRGLHIGLSSVIGKTGAFASLQLGASLLGRGTIVGRPDPGTNVGNSRVGGDTMVG